MKKKLIASLATIMVLGVAGTSFAATNAFSDVPTDHWAYGAVTQLEKDGILDNNDKFGGERTLSRYEMAIVVARAMSKVDKANASDKALITKLEDEFSAELSKLDAKYDSLEKKVDNITLSGFTRVKYDSDTVRGQTNSNTDNGNKHFYMDLVGQMKVNDGWTAYFEDETAKGYTDDSWGTINTGGTSNGGDGAIERVWTTGNVGKVGVTIGQKWWGYASCVLFGHSADGVQLDLPLNSQVTVSAFDLKPSQGGLTESALSNPYNTSLRGLMLSDSLSKTTNFTLIGGNNPKTGDLVTTDSNGNVTSDTTDTNVTQWEAIDASTKLGENIKLTGTYTKTNADSYNNSHEIRLDYKAVDLNTPGSYDIYFRDITFQKYGDISHDDEWASLPGDMKGWVIGVDYALAKNVEWSSLYSPQTINLSTTQDPRKLIRTEVDFHF